MIGPHSKKEHGDEHQHGHTHGAVDPSLFRTDKGIQAVKISLAGLILTALMQIVVVYFTGSVALLADTIHNLGDGLTALPLWAAFVVGKKKPTRRFTYGYGRLEDIAGLIILLMIAVSAGVAAYESIRQLFEPQPVTNLWAVFAASLIGFAGNEAVAYYRIKVGREIGSEALVADGYHARVDGLSSLAVLLGAVGIALGFPIADPLAGLLITGLILKILWETGKSVFSRLMDGVDPKVVDEIHHTAMGVKGVESVDEIRVRWLGHRMVAELNIAVDPQLSVVEAHEIARQVDHQLLHHLEYLSTVNIHVDPLGAVGAQYHTRPGSKHEAQRDISQ